MESGNHTLMIDCEFDNPLGNPELHITANSGNIILQTAPLSKGESSIFFTLNKTWDNVEFKIANESFPKIEVKDMFLEREVYVFE